MSDRMDELKGRVKEGTGKVTGNERLEAEGKGQAEAARTERRVKGAAREAAGSLKEGVGKLTGDRPMEEEGAANRMEGRSEQAG
jgi:uncharacterized protein YjbJ (UPF0337 family)